MKVEIDLKLYSYIRQMAGGVDSPEKLIEYILTQHVNKYLKMSQLDQLKVKCGYEKKRTRVGSDRKYEWVRKKIPHKQ
jgi:hypothetical protein